MSMMLDGIARVIARYLQKPIPGYEPFTPSDPEALRQSLLPGDVLLVEGNNNVSGVIKYLTQSTWSHSALYVGPLAGRFGEDGKPHVLIEANLGEGVVAPPGLGEGLQPGDMSMGIAAQEFLKVEEDEDQGEPV